MAPRPTGLASTRIVAFLCELKYDRIYGIAGEKTFQQSRSPSLRSSCRGTRQPRSQGLRGETVTKPLVKFVLSFQIFWEKNRMHSATQPYCNNEMK